MNDPASPPLELLVNGLSLGISHGIRVYTRQRLAASTDRPPTAA
jgi:hypothetical protein